jgi:hypothetical protein
MTDVQVMEKLHAQTVWGDKVFWGEKRRRKKKKKKIIICYQLRPEVQTFSHRSWYTANNDGKPLNQCAGQLFPILLVAHLESQNLTSVCTVVRSTSTWSVHMGWTANIHLVNGAAYDKGREAQRVYHKRFLNSVCVQIIVRLLLLTIAYGKQVHLL